MSHNEIEDYEERKTFLENLKTLNKIEQEEVFRILKKNASSFSENSNGIFLTYLALILILLKNY